MKPKEHLAEAASVMKQAQKLYIWSKQVFIVHTEGITVRQPISLLYVQISAGFTFFSLSPFLVSSAKSQDQPVSNRMLFRLICCRKKVGKVQSSSFAKSPKGKPGPAVPLECNLEIDFTAKPLLKYYNKGLAYHIYGMLQLFMEVHTQKSSPSNHMFWIVLVWITVIWLRGAQNSSN